MRAVAEQMHEPEPEPAFADGRYNLLGPGTVEDVGRGQVQHVKAAIRVHSDMLFSAFDALAGVISTAAHQAAGALTD